MGLDRLPLGLRLSLYAAASLVLLFLTQAPSPALPQIELWDKAEHAIAWLVLAASGLILFPRRPLRIAVFALAFGVLVELLQGWLPYGRDCDWKDLLADGFGVAVALLAGAAVRRARV
ncbi:MAG TPA: VanZ family protein [Phenylobacterium sp.]|uniref:VanZ family protein n=1 Tax=Phenylobacterium sp. TaxID=1871053 RepID=UPI002C40C486|nr:VanZ family protein [Phenylobacterium sp.]HSV02678.1 VanZ family protein [Phenylobacterium sp.]